MSPLVILGGGRESASPQFELYEEDDSVINGDVSRALKDFLPNLFEGRYEKGREPEMEWVCVRLFSLDVGIQRTVLDRNHGNN